MSTDADAERDATDDAVNDETATGDSDVEALGRDLGEAIAALPEYERFESTKTAVEEHEDAQERIAEVERLREEFMVARQLGEADQEDLATLKTAQQELHELPVMESYLDAQAALTGRLQAVDEAISEPLALDFSDQAGSCCHDEE